ncbi:unnamed protein product [Thlaspi arvense]|uniref:Uncharacterized protein n=1 Tax=Thlaspi arvense TaxID=13288 RepID=A0AAU9STR0_THLAR|nr:unnamed protein product [Thlaspi arvense]
MVLKPCAGNSRTERDSSNLEEAIESMEASSVVLKPCSAEKTKKGYSSKLEEEEEEAAEPMEASSSVVIGSCLTKRKAEFDLEEEESDGEIDEARVERARAKEREAEKALLDPPEWDVDSFDDLKYYSSPESNLSSDEQPYENMENAKEHYRIYKRQLIDSKGFKVDPGLRPSDRYLGINPDSNVEFAELVRGNYRGGPRPKSYITFMAREKPDGPLVEYQTKAMITLDHKMHPIICRPAPTQKL